MLGMVVSLVFNVMLGMVVSLVFNVMLGMVVSCYKYVYLYNGTSH